MSNSTTVKNVKPLGIKAYGSIPHLPGSRRGTGDHGLSDEQAAICTTKARDSKDVIIVQEKLDGTGVSVAKINGECVALIRAGYRACDSPREQHQMFHEWVLNKSYPRFESLLDEGERVCGEWLALAHGTRYQLPHEPFVPFDIMVGHRRAPAEEVAARCRSLAFTPPYEIHCGGPCCVQFVMEHFSESSHGGIGGIEGAVWRVERNGEVDFLGKYVRPDKVDGSLLIENSGEDIWNWRPE